MSFGSTRLRQVLIAIAISLPGLIALVLLVTPPDGVPAIALAVNPLLLLLVFTFGGGFAAPRMNLKSRVLLGDSQNSTHLVFYLLIGALVGLSLGVLDQATASVWRPAGGELKTLLEASDLSGLTIGILYGGIAEEIILRWGFLSLVALGFSTILRRRVAIQMAILLSAALFSAGHLPARFLVAPDPAGVVLVRTLAINLIAGIIFGYAYVRTSLEAAFISHMGFHIGVFLIATVLLSS